MFHSKNLFFVCSIEPLAFPASNIKLCHSRWYCSCLTHVGWIFPFMPPEKIKNLWFSDVSKVYEKLTLTATVLILVVCRNYNILQSFCFENYWLGKQTYISKTWNFKFSIFSSKLIFCILSLHNFWRRWWGQNVMPK